MNSVRINPIFHVLLLKPAVPDPFPERNSGPPGSVMVDGEEEYEVEAIMDCRKRSNQI